MSKQPSKKKSERRFEQLNMIVDDIAPTLPTPSHVAILLCCFRHGRGAGYFRVSTNRLAKSSCIGKRQVQRVIDDFEKTGIIELVTEHQGPIPRTYRITFKRFNGDTHDTIKPHHPPQANGDMEDA